jgi:hypothetical protein
MQGQVWSLRYNSDHGKIFFQGNFFLAGVAAVGDVVQLVVSAGGFCNEDVVSKLDAAYQSGWN